MLEFIAILSCVILILVVANNPKIGEAIVHAETWIWTKAIKPFAKLVYERLKR